MAGPSPFGTGLRCRCPRCGQGRLYQGFLTVRQSCPACGLDYGPADSGDGPAVLVILVLGAVVVLAALIVEAKLEPPMWVHAVLWPPLILGGAIGLLRPLKSLMLSLQFHHRAGEASRSPK
ncbi:MAG: DUF983 domain-containing protein [Dongiaceae bacterium]